MPLITCKINLILIQSTYCITSSATGTTKFAITDTEIYVAIVTSSTQDNAKLLQQLKSSLEEQQTEANINQKCQQENKASI